MSYLPYPGRYESHDSWMRRCDEYHRWNRRSQSRGLRGRPYKRYIEGGKDGTCETFVKIAGQYQKVKIPMMDEREGKLVRIYKRGYGYQNSMRVRDFAEKHGLHFAKYNGNGCQGMCERTDGIAFRYIG